MIIVPRYFLQPPSTALLKSRLFFRVSMGLSGTQPLSALLPPPLKNSPSGPGAHPLAEAVVLFPFSGIRLICSLHLPSFQKNMKIISMPPLGVKESSCLCDMCALARPPAGLRWAALRRFPLVRWSCRGRAPASWRRYVLSQVGGLFRPPAPPAFSSPCFSSFPPQLRTFSI